MAFIAELGEQVFDVLSSPQTFQSVVKGASQIVGVNSQLAGPSIREGIRTPSPWAGTPAPALQAASGGLATTKWGAPPGASSANIIAPSLASNYVGQSIPEKLGEILGVVTGPSREFETSVDNNTIKNFVLGGLVLMLVWKFVR